MQRIKEIKEAHEKEMEEKKKLEKSINKDHVKLLLEVCKEGDETNADIKTDNTVDTKMEKTT